MAAREFVGALREAGFTATGLSEAFGQPYLPPFRSQDQVAGVLNALGRKQPRLLQLVSWLMGDTQFDRSEFQRIFAGDLLAELSEAKVLRRRWPSKSYVFSRAISPLENMYIATDKTIGLEHRDDVLPIIDEQHIVATLIRDERRAACLDLGTGSGALALVSSRFCDRVDAVDVNPRAVAMAGFNCSLNAVENVKVIEQDAVSFLQRVETPYDLILFNTPYNPSPRNRQRFCQYAHSGVDGSELISSVLPLLPGVLAPGGVCVIVTRVFGSGHTSPRETIGRLINKTQFEAFVFRTSPASLHSLAALAQAAWSTDAEGAEDFVTSLRSRGLNSECFAILLLRKLRFTCHDARYEELEAGPRRSDLLAHAAEARSRIAEFLAQGS